MCARNEQSLLFDMFNAFDQTESSHKSDFCFLQKDLFSFMRAQYDLSYHLTKVPCHARLQHTFIRKGERGEQNGKNVGGSASFQLRNVKVTVSLRITKLTVLSLVLNSTSNFVGRHHKLCWMIPQSFSGYRYCRPCTLH